MADESELLHLPQFDRSLLIRTEAHSSLITRGRKDAAVLISQKPAPRLPVGVAYKSSVRSVVLNDADSQFKLGQKHFHGQGIPQDLAKAEMSFRKAGNQGIPAANYYLGLLYVNGGLGVVQDHAQAVLHFRKAAEQGLAPAQYNLGWLLEFGTGVTQDLQKAAVWYLNAADQGFALAQFSLATSYAYGRGVPQDRLKAAAWYQEAANQGREDAQFDFTCLDESGHDLLDSYREVYFWFGRKATTSLVTPAAGRAGQSEMRKQASKWLQR